MKQRMATFADQFGPVPGKEGSGWLPNVDRMRHSSQANRASSLLIAKGPQEAQEAQILCLLCLLWLLPAMR